MFSNSEFLPARMPASSNKMFGVRWWLLLFIVGVTVTRTVHGGEARVVCYYTNWSVYRPGTARFNPQNINPYLCTHLIYAFGGFTKDNTLKPFDKYQDIEKGGYAKFTGLKTYNKELKTLLAIGGWNEGSTRFSPMVSARDRRKEFVRNVIKFLRQNRFDGLDLDWEYPAFRDGGKPKDRENYAKLVKELREEFEKEAEKSGRPRLLLTMAVPAGIEYIQKGFDVKTLNMYLDWMNLLTYDYHSAFEPTVNHHAPLYPLEEPNEYSVDGELNIDYTIQFYLENGADREKLVLGIPTYGRSYTLYNAQATDIGSPADGPGEQGDATREKGYLAYYEICEAIKGKPKTEKPKVDDDDDSSSEDEEEVEEDEPWTVVKPKPDAMGPIAYKGNQWVGYDDVDIAKKKAEYVAEKGLGGIMFWSIDNDDFRGNCHGKPYPLIEAAKEALITKLGSQDNVVVTERAVNSASSGRRKSRPRVSSSTASPSSTRTPKPVKKQQVALSSTPAWAIDTPEPPTTPDPGSDFKCTDEGFFQHPRDCKKYFWCLDSGPSNLGIVAHQFTCPSGLFFNKAADSCDFARNVICKKPAATTTAPTTARTTTTTATTTAAARTTTTTRRPVKLSTKNSAFFRTTSTTTVSPEEEDLVDAEIEEDTDFVDAEDPRVIKELIDLIRKVGGVEQLERHLKLAEGSNSASADGTTTSSPISKKLYQKVLESRQNTKSLFQKYNSIAKELPSSANSRPGPQNAGLDALPETTNLRREKPQYTTINRARPSTPAKEEEVAESRDKADSLEEENKDSFRNTDVSVKPLPQYVNIRRPRPQQTSDLPDDTASRNALFERNEASILPHAETDAPVDLSSARRENIPEYVTIRRQRPTTTEEPTTSAKYQVLERETISSSVVEESITPSVAKNQYSSLQRVRSSTTEETLTSPEPTTVLSVQISSLLNSPSDLPESSTLKEELVTEGSTTTSTTTSTSTPSSTIVQSNAPQVTSTRRPGIRRRGTTTPQTITSTTGQVSSERNHSTVRRRRPVVRPNDISADSDLEINTRKIRSTTPDSRETQGFVNANAEIGVVNFRSRQNSDDAQSIGPISRGRYRPTFSRDEVSSLPTPVDPANEEKKNITEDRLPVRFQRRFRPSSTAESPRDAVTTSTVESKRNEFTIRGRNRFIATTTTVPDEIPKKDENNKRLIRPVSRLSPRPFSRSVLTLNKEQTKVSDDTLKEIRDLEVNSRIPSRVSSDRETLFARNSDLSDLPLARRVPYIFNGPEIVQNYNIGDDNIQDFALSESSIEEKEHVITTYEGQDNLPRRKVIIKKLKSSNQNNLDRNQPDDEINPDGNPLPEDSQKQRRVRVLKRKPATTTQSPETIEFFPETSTSRLNPRVRKILRKKIVSSTTTQNSVSSENSTLANQQNPEPIVNYGEKYKTASKNRQQIDIEESPITQESVPIELGPDIDVSIISSDTSQQNLTNDQKEDQIPTQFINTDQPQVIDTSSLSTTSFQQVEEEFPKTTQPPTTTTETVITTTTNSKTLPSRGRLPYKPPRRQFTTSTEAPPSSRTYSRKFNPGAYTSPSTVDREKVTISTKKQLFTARPYGRKPQFTTTRTSEKEIVENFSEDEYETEVDEPLSEFVLVPENQLFSRGPNFSQENTGFVNSNEEKFEIEEEMEEVIEQSSRKPLFRPKPINSNTFRTSTTTTEIPKELKPRNRTSLYTNRFNNKGSQTKKRIQNVPNYSLPKEKITDMEIDKEQAIETTTILAMTQTNDFGSDEENEYLSVTINSKDYQTTDASTGDENTTEQIDMDPSTDDYLESTEAFELEMTTVNDYHTVRPYYEKTTSKKIQVPVNLTATTVSDESLAISTTALPSVIKSKLDKLFSVSRVVEVSSKLDKHKLNKKNESRLVESGSIMQEKKPEVDKIGEVSRFTLIKIVEDEIPIYLTKYGHVYPVDNPPDNPIRIDEARNARALQSFTDIGKENLLASESMNKPYRHSNQAETPVFKKDDLTEDILKEDFQILRNDDLTEKPSSTFPIQWQFVPAAYENDQNQPKYSSKYTTPRNINTNPSTIALEGLFKIENPVSVQSRKVKEGNLTNNARDHPFIVYSASVPNTNTETAEFVKVQVLKPEQGRSVTTYAKGQELSGEAVNKETTIKYPVLISVYPSEPLNLSDNTNENVLDTTPSATTSDEKTTMQESSTFHSAYTTVTSIAEETTETVTEPPTTAQTTIISNDALASIAKKRPKLTFPKRPNFRAANITRPPILLANKSKSVPNKTSPKTTASSVKTNKTTTLSSSKSRFSGTRGQNTPVDGRIIKTTPTIKPVQNTLAKNSTLPKVSRSEDSRKLFFKPIRPSLLRPAFIPRRSTTPPEVTGET